MITDTLFRSGHGTQRSIINVLMAVHPLFVAPLLVLGTCHSLELLPFLYQQPTWLYYFFNCFAFTCVLIQIFCSFNLFLSFPGFRKLYNYNSLSSLPILYLFSLPPLRPFYSSLECILFQALYFFRFLWCLSISSSNSNLAWLSSELTFFQTFCFTFPFFSPPLPFLYNFIRLYVFGCFMFWLIFIYVVLVPFTFSLFFSSSSSLIYLAITFMYDLLLPLLFL